MPASNAELTLRQTWQEIPRELVDEIVLIDDGSRDTVELARNLGITVIEHPENRGYGGCQKTCYREALSPAPKSSPCFTPTISTMHALRVTAHRAHEVADVRIATARGSSVGTSIACSCQQLHSTSSLSMGRQSG